MRSLARTIANAVKTPVPYTSPGRYTSGGSPYAAGNDRETYMRTYGSAGTVFQIVNLLATSCADAEWSLYRKQKQDGRQRYTTGDQGSDQRVEVLQHQALNVWNNPNPFTTRAEFDEMGQMYLELTGEEWQVIQRDPRASFPIARWQVRPDRMEVVPSAENFIAGYVYNGPGGEKVPLGLDEVILTKYPNPFDPFRGLGPVQSILIDIDAMRYSAQWNRNFFLNSAMPGGIIQTETNLDDNQFRELVNRWREGHQGVSRAGRVGILEAGQSWVTTQTSIKDMDFSNLRNVSRDVIREAWGVHKSMLGNADDVNRANAQTAEEVYGRWKVIPRLKRRRMAANFRFLPMFYNGAVPDVEFDYKNPLPDDREADNSELTAKSQAAAILVGAGYDPTEVCEVVGLPEMSFSAPAPAIGSGQNPEGDTSGDPAENPDDNPATQNRARIQIWRPAAVAGDLATVDAQWHAAVDQLAAEYQDQVIPDQQAQLADQIRKAFDAADLAALAALALDTAAAQAVLLAAMVAYARVAANQAAGEAEAAGAGSVPVTVPPAAELELVAEVTVALLAAELAASAGREALRVWDSHSSGQQIAADVAAFLAGLSFAAVLVHLSAAMSSAQNKARLATFKAGPHVELYASEVLDHNTCEPCRLINGTDIGSTSDPDIAARVEALYPGGGYVDCLGLERCRGTIRARYEQTTNAAWPPLWHVNGHPQMAGVR